MPSEYQIIDSREWKVLGIVEAEDPVHALKLGMLKFNNANIVAVYKDFKSDD